MEAGRRARGRTGRRGVGSRRLGCGCRFRWCEPARARRGPRLARRRVEPGHHRRVDRAGRCSLPPAGALGGLAGSGEAAQKTMTSQRPPTIAFVLPAHRGSRVLIGDQALATEPEGF